jgi:uncharacterized membrane protein (DUF106 family)
MLFRIILWSIIISVLLRFVFRFLLPVIHVTGEAKKRMSHMQKQMEDLQKQQQRQQPSRSSKIEGDYIEYEEVK